MFPFMDRNEDNRAGVSMSPFSVRKQEYVDRTKPLFIVRRESVKEVYLSYQLRKLIHECFTRKK